MANSDSEARSVAGTEEELGSSEDEGDRTKIEPSEGSDAENESNSHGGNEASPGPSPQPSNILMICVPGLSGEQPVLQSNTRMQFTANIANHSFKPEKILGENGSIENLDGVIDELLDFILFVPSEIGISLSDLVLGFMTCDLGVILVKKALLRAAKEPKYHGIYTNTTFLVFFGTPHRASKESSWETTILRIIEDTYRGVWGPWLPGRIHQLSSYLEQLQVDFSTISERFRILNYYQDIPESSSELVTVHKSCTELRGLNVANIGRNVSHVELHHFVDESPEEDVILDQILSTLPYTDKDYIRFIQWLSLEADRIETEFQMTGRLENLADCIAHSEELATVAYDDQARIISLDIGMEVDGRQFLSSFSGALRRTSHRYPGATIACTTLSPSEPSSLTEYGLLSGCIIQILKQRPNVYKWMKPASRRLLDSLRIPNPKLKTMALWESLRLAFLHDSDWQGFWVIHTTYTPRQRQLLSQVVTRLRYFEEVDHISWKVIIVGNFVSRIQFPSSNAVLRIVLKQDALRTSVEKDIESQLDLVIRDRPPLSNARENLLQLLKKHESDYKSIGAFLDALPAVLPPLPYAAIDGLADILISTDITYHTILEGVPKNCRAWAHTVLVFLCFSMRPLSVGELAIATAAMESESFEQLQKSVDYGIATYIQELLPGIVQVRPGGVYAIHDSLGSYLRRSPSDAWYHVENCHLKIALACYKYLVFLLDQLDDVEMSPVEATVKKMRYARIRPGYIRQAPVNDKILRFAPYASSYWCEHFLLSDDHEAANLQPKPWLTDASHLKEILALRYYSTQPYEEEFNAPQQFMPLQLREELDMSERDAFELMVQLVDRHPSDAYVDLMYPSTPSKNEAARDWITSNFTPLDVRDVVARHPKALDWLLVNEKETILDRISDLLVSVASHNNPSLLAGLLGKLDKQISVREVSCEALDHAISWGMVDIAKILLGYQETPFKDFRTKDDPLTLLGAAISTGNKEMIQLLLDAGASVDDGLPDHGYPLHVACRLGLVDVARMLLGAGATVDLADENHMTALHLTSFHGFPSTYKLLCEHGATFTLNKRNQSPLHHLARYYRRPRYRETAVILIDNLREKFPSYKETGSQDAERLSNIINSRSEGLEMTALSYAALAGDVDLAKSIIDLGGSERTIEENGLYALSRAAVMGNVGVVRCLLDNGVPIDRFLSNGRQVLHEACSSSTQEVIEVLLQRNAPVDQLEANKAAPIGVAASWGRFGVVKQLIPLSSKKSISSALLNAARFGYHEIVTLLLNAGADINYQDDFGNTALQFACWDSFSRVTQLLLARIPDVNRTDCDNSTATADSARRSSYDCLKLLLDAGADPEIESKSGERALITAAHADNECFKLLLERGAETVLPKDLEKPPDERAFRFGLSFLSGLVYGVRFEAVKVYLEYLKSRVSKEAFSSEINEALVTASYAERLRDIPLLLEYGADPNVIVSKFDAKHGSAVSVAVAYDKTESLKALLDNKVTPVDLNRADDYRDTPLHIALDWSIGNMQEEVVDLLLAHGADPTIISGTYGTVLNATCEVRNEEIFNKILSQPGVSRDIADDQGRLPLHTAAARRQTERRIDVLTTKSSTFRSTDKQGRNVLHHAAAGGSCDLLRKILKECPDLINVPDHDGWTPLHWACRQNNEKATEFLIQYGANKEAKTHDKWTARHVAVYHAMPAHLEYLSEDSDEFDEELPSEAAERVIDYLCDSCFCGIYGTGYHCGTCPEFWYCYKCHWSHEETHPKHHVFLRVDQDTSSKDSPPASEPDTQD